MPARSAAHLRPAPTPPVLQLVHLTTHATYSLRPDRRAGGISAQSVRAVTQLLRCHHTGKRHAISRRLIEVLYSTARHFHSPRLYVVAGYRAPRIAKEKGNPKSPHKRGVACDFRLEGVAIETVRDYLKQKYRDAGVGYYPNSGFVHLDVGRTRAASWIDYSAPGERSRYAGSLAPVPSATGTDDRSE
jgi:uncharacterized protein YcbK (DUF882 family)